LSYITVRRRQCQVEGKTGCETIAFGRDAVYGLPDARDAAAEVVSRETADRGRRRRRRGGDETDDILLLLSSSTRTQNRKKKTAQESTNRVYDKYACNTLYIDIRILYTHRALY